MGERGTQEADKKRYGGRDKTNGERIGEEEGGRETERKRGRRWKAGREVERVKDRNVGGEGGLKREGMEEREWNNG